LARVGLAAWAPG